jgi:hypothetical protein
MTDAIPRSRVRTMALLAWIAVKVALFVLLGRTDVARFVYAGF